MIFLPSYQTCLSPLASPLARVLAAGSAVHPCKSCRPAPSDTCALLQPCLSSLGQVPAAVMEVHFLQGPEGMIGSWQVPLMHLKLRVARQSLARVVKCMLGGSRTRNSQRGQMRVGRVAYPQQSARSKVGGRVRQPDWIALTPGPTLPMLQCSSCGRSRRTCRHIV